MKRIKTLALAALFIVATLFQTGCIGSFKMTNSLYDWNKSLNGKVAQEAVFLAFVIIPVYGVTLLIDGVILNSIEFWSGSNPMSMAPGDEETQIVENEGVKYMIKATQNRFHFEQLTGEEAGESFDLVFSETTNSWNLEKDGSSVRVTDWNTGRDGTVDSYNLYKPDGSVVEIDPSVRSANAIRAALSLELQPAMR